MRLSITLASIMASFCAAAAIAPAQTTAPALPAKQAGPILEQIPSGAFGFIVVQDVRSSTQQVDKFLARIEQFEAIKSEKVKDFLDLIRTEAKLGEGFDPAGGFAAVMLDPQQFGITAEGLMSQHDKNGNKIEPPIVLMVPGTGIDSVFSQYERATPEGAKHVQVKLRMGPMFAAAANGYVVLSPREDTLEAVIGAKQNVTADLSADELKMVRASTAAVYVNMKVAGPVFIKVLKQMEDMMTMMQAMGGRNGGAEAMQMNLAKQWMPMYRQFVEQLESGLLTVKLTDLGPMLDARVNFVKDSELGKSIAGAKAIEKSMLSRLPNLDYIFAMEASGGVAQTKMKAVADQTDKWLADPGMADIPEATKARIKKCVSDWNQQVQGMQLVFGGAPKGKGMMALAVVLDCKDSAKVKDLLAEGVDLAAEVLLKKLGGLLPAPGGEGDAPAGPVNVPQMAPPIAAADKADPAAKETAASTPASAPATQPAFTVAYKKAATKAGTVSVDAIVVSAPDMAKHQQDLVKYLGGDEQLRLLVAAPTDNLVVLTFGGAEDFMALALKSATDNSGDIAGKDAQTAIAELPKARSALALFNLTNTFKLVKQISPDDKNAAQFTSNVPASLGVSLSDNVVQYTVFAPNAMIKEIVKSVKAEEAMPGEGPGGGSTTKPAETKKPHEDF